MRISVVFIYEANEQASFAADLIRGRNATRFVAS